MKKERRKRTLYCKELEMPIVANRLGFSLAKITGLKPPPFDKYKFEKSDKYIAQKKYEKLKLLFDHFGIEPNDLNPWFQLALKLAETHVNGFKIIYEDERKEPGRHDCWTNKTHFRLIKDVESYQSRGAGKSKERTINAACRYLLTQNPYKNITEKGKPMNFKSLARQYRNAKGKYKLSPESLKNVGSFLQTLLTKSPLGRG